AVAHQARVLDRAGARAGEQPAREVVAVGLRQGAPEPRVVALPARVSVTQARALGSNPRSEVAAVGVPGRARSRGVHVSRGCRSRRRARWGATRAVKSPGSGARTTRRRALRSRAVNLDRLSALSSARVDGLRHRLFGWRWLGAEA